VLETSSIDLLYSKVDAVELSAATAGETKAAANRAAAVKKRPAIVTGAGDMWDFCQEWEEKGKNVSNWTLPVKIGLVEWCEDVADERYQQHECACPSPYNKAASSGWHTHPNADQHQIYFPSEAQRIREDSASIGTLVA
jgi:hypothetical protein